MDNEEVVLGEKDKAGCITTDEIVLERSKR
jgi:hypothetical protein